MILLKHLIGYFIYIQFAACLMAGWVILASGASLGYGTLALPSMQNNNSLEVTESDASWMASSMMLGALSGAILSGPCIAFGRRATIWFLAFPLTAAWTLIGFSKQLWTLVIAHAILGVCLGLIGDATQIYVCEVTFLFKKITSINIFSCLSFDDQVDNF